jgi:hypothetical protein
MRVEQLGAVESAAQPIRPERRLVVEKSPKSRQQVDVGPAGGDADELHRTVMLMAEDDAPGPRLSPLG